MKLIDLNKKGEIGSNSLYLEIGPFKLVIDSGLHPKYVGNDALPEFSAMPEGVILDGIVLTHCHLDHLGSLPVLAQKFPTAPILLTPSSALLAVRMMHNSVSIMHIQKAELGVREYPLYTRSQIGMLENRFLPTEYKKTRVLRKGNDEIKLTLYNSGHVPGAASVMLEYRHRKIFITGDVLFDRLLTIPGADWPKEKVDTVIMETTRGATTRQASREEETARLLKTINDTINGGGSVLLPVFALGRMQEILMILNEARKRGELAKAPIFTTGLGMDLVDYYDVLRRKGHEVNFNKKVCKELRTRRMPEHIDHNSGIKERGIYVVSSGMMVEKTPSYGVGAAMLEDSKSAILFVGYCDPQTPGGVLLSLKNEERYLFKALNHEADLRARIERFDLSGHADKEDLVDAVAAMDPRAVVLTHGDILAREVIRRMLEEQHVRQVVDPMPGKEYDV